MLNNNVVATLVALLILGSILGLTILAPSMLAGFLLLGQSGMNLAVNVVIAVSVLILAYRGYESK